MMNLSFFTQIFGRSVQLSSSFGKTFSYVRNACYTKTKCIKLIFIGKITLVPVAFLMALSIDALYVGSLRIKISHFFFE